MTPGLKDYVSSNPKLKKIANVLYAVIATYLASKYIAINGIPMGDLFATIAAICMLPVVFLITRTQIQLKDEHQAKFGKERGDEGLKAYVANHPKLKKISYVLYAAIASYFASKYIAVNGFAIGDLFATIIGICFVPIVFLVTQTQKEVAEEFKANA